MCLYPKLIKNRKYEKNKKNGGIVPAILDERTKAVPVACGRCMECKKKKAREWQVRLLEDVRHEKNGIFVTLTFSNESIKELSEALERENGYKLKGYELDNEIAIIAVKRFRERWRKEHKKSVRHWLVTELGHNGTENIHMHGIIWTDKPSSEINKHWKYGFTWLGNNVRGKEVQNYVTERTVNYITKYISKTDIDHKEYIPKILTSAGIGAGYMKRIDSEKNKYKIEGTKETYTTRTGHNMSLPIYYRNKIYAEEERERLWIEKLDKEERWICGERISIKEGEEEYYKTLQYYRIKNKKLGYQDDQINWNRKKYEEQRRTLLQQERIANAKDGLRAEEAPLKKEASSGGMAEVMRGKYTEEREQ